MSTAWLVTTGEYSSYSVRYVCLTEEDARAVVDKLEALERHSPGYEIEEREIVRPDEINKATNLYLRTRIPMDNPFQVVDESTLDFVDVGEINLPDLRVEWDPVTRKLSVWGSDHERVRKVMSERRAALIAEAEGVA